MDTVDLNKIEPASEKTSNPGYVQLPEETASKTISSTSPVHRSVNVFQFPGPSDSGAKIKISLSQEQLKIKTRQQPVQNPEMVKKAVHSSEGSARKVSLQSPIKQKPEYTTPSHKSMQSKEANNARDWATKTNCKLCGGQFVDPRVLSCLHTFCMTCLQKRMDLDSDALLTEKSSTSGTNSSSQSGDPPSIPPPPRSSLRRASQKSLTSSVTTSASKGRRSFNLLATFPRNPVCAICGSSTPLPIGGISRLPKNTILNRLMDTHSSQPGQQRPMEICDNCSSANALAVTHHCQDCAMNLCALCSDGHKKQKITSTHKQVKWDGKRLSDKDSKKASKKCPFHPNSDLKLFCTNCNQVACSECLAVLHTGHKCESIHKTIKVYSKLLNDSIKRVRPSSDYATLTISKLTSITKKIDKKCDSVRHEVEAHLFDYQKALDHHRNTLLHQVQRAREMKMAAIESQTTDLEKRSSEAKSAIEFAEMILENGSDLEIMSFIGIILKRFEYCEKSTVPLDANVNDALRFLPEIRAPSTSAQNNIPLFGIITTQTADPNLCSIEGTGLNNLKVNKRVELVLIARDRDNKQLCHGGLTLQVELKYADFAGRPLDHQATDKRDGSYQIVFTPDAAGTIRLSVCIAGKPIRDNPFLLTARNLKPHSGIYHCCTFCSSSCGGGSAKTTICACGGTMEGFSGCGHGHVGHPGRRHWSCCGNILENSECLTANEFEY